MRLVVAMSSVMAEIDRDGELHIALDESDVMEMTVDQVPAWLAEDGITDLVARKPDRAFVAQWSGRNRAGLPVAIGVILVSL